MTLPPGNSNCFSYRFLLKFELLWTFLLFYNSHTVQFDTPPSQSLAQSDTNDENSETGLQYIP